MAVAAAPKGEVAAAAAVGAAAGAVEAAVAAAMHGDGDYDSHYSV